MTTQGFTTDQFAPVREVLETQLTTGADIGASVCVHHRGEVVVDLWGGHTDAERTGEWQDDTIVNVWSTTKTMTFLVALMLADRGELDFDAPVATYWPEFAANGKAGVEVRHVMSHTSGLSGFGERIEPEDLADWERCVGILAAQEPWWEPGTMPGYHAITQGYLIGEIVRRITGDTIGTFFRREVAEPLGADFHIGLPESEEDRVSLVIPPKAADFGKVDPESLAFRTYASSRIDARAPHHRWWRAAEIPAANGHGNARSVALVQSIIANRGETGGRRFLSGTTVDRIFDSQIQGFDPVLARESHMGMGYGLSNPSMPIGPRACYWGGYGGSVIIMDLDAQLTVAYMMNKMELGLSGDFRGANIAMAAALATAD
ncbi:MAG: beta-lactamase family protein [Acidobacteria bacterium]|nr:beta-lactamase family protein [Acidobacteriota bacterium]